MIAHIFTTLLHGASLFRAETAHLPLAVLIWMWAMRISLGASIVFLPRPGALATLGVMLTTGLSRFYIKGLYPDIPAAHIGAISHIVLWAPLAGFLIYTMSGKQIPTRSNFERAYRIWRAVAIAVIAVSLVFDVREVAAILG